MLHKIWGVPTVARVCKAAIEGLQSSDQVVIVGIKAAEVAECLGQKKGRKFIFQEEQKGTGHAVKVAIDSLNKTSFDRDFFIFPGDMGLLNTETIKRFMEDFKRSKADMLVLIGLYTGHPDQNYYGRIVRVPAHDVDGRDSGDDKGRIIQILEHKDILALNPDAKYIIDFKNRKYGFSRKELLEIKEFGTSVYAYKGKYLREYIDKIGFDNAQGEMYLTDLIYLFNKAGLTVEGAVVGEIESVIGFNDKAVLHQMQGIARERVYNKLNKIISIRDKHNFFIADEVVEHILEMDKADSPLDIRIGEGVYLGPGVRLNKGVEIEKNANLTGNIILGANVLIGESVYMSTYEHQKILIGEHSEVLQQDILKGNITIGNDTRIETPVRITGSETDPTYIGNNVRIKGSSYIYGCIIEDNTQIVNSVLLKKKIKHKKDKEGKTIIVSNIFPDPTGRECVEHIE